MVSRWALRGIIEMEMAHLQEAESQLTGQFKRLPLHGQDEHRAFLSALRALESRAAQLEQLIELLGNHAPCSEPAAA